MAQTSIYKLYVFVHLQDCPKNCLVCSLLSGKTYCNPNGCNATYAFKSDDGTCVGERKAHVDKFTVKPARAAQIAPEGGLVKCCCFFSFVAICVRPIMSTSNRPIFTKFVGLVELWLQMNDPRVVFRSIEVGCRDNQLFLVLSASIRRIGFA